MSEQMDNIDQLFGSLKNHEVAEPISPNEWSGIQNKMMARNFFKFNLGSFNVFYAAILAIGTSYGIYHMMSSDVEQTSQPVKDVIEQNKEIAPTTSTKEHANPIENSETIKTLDQDQFTPNVNSEEENASTVKAIQNSSTPQNNSTSNTKISSATPDTHGDSKLSSIGDALEGDDASILNEIDSLVDHENISTPEAPVIKRKTTVERITTQERIVVPNEESKKEKKKKK